jgi:lipopolysaccharide transport system ATP-binding protein
VSAKGEIVVRARGLGKVFRLYPTFWARLAELLPARRGRFSREVEALRSIDLEIARGECVGVMGPNGAGKSTLLKLLKGSLFPTSGSVEVDGRVTLLDLRGSLNPELSGRENLVTSGIALGISRRDVMERLEEMIAFCELGQAIDDPLKTYSTGMAMRLAFSLYAHTNPDVLIVDEAFAVGDARFVLKCTGRLRQLLESGVAILLASHDSNAIAELCDRAIVLHHGSICFSGDPVEAGDAYHRVLGLAPGQIPHDAPDASAAAAPPTTVGQFLASAVRRDPASLTGADVEILGLRVLRNDRPCGGILRHGDRCRVEWLLHARRSVERLTSGIHLHSQLGTYLFGTSYIHLGQPIRIDAPGHYLLAIRIDLQLAPGKYVLSVGAAEPELARHSIGGRQLDRIRSAFEFEVLDFELVPDEPVPFFGAVRLPAQADPPRLLAE